jgi:hypothetical protein
LWPIKGNFEFLALSWTLSPHRLLSATRNEAWMGLCLVKFAPSSRQHRYGSLYALELFQYP